MNHYCHAMFFKVLSSQVYFAQKRAHSMKAGMHQNLCEGIEDAIIVFTTRKT